MVAVRVLYVADASEEIVDASMSSHSAPGRSLRGLPASFVVDEDYAPVPIRTARQDALARFEEPEGGRYLLRGEVNEADLPRIRFDADGRLRVFSDPRIATMTGVCGSDPPIGTTDDVRSLLDVAGLQRRGMTGTGVAIAIVDNGINLPHLQAMGLMPHLDTRASWTPPSSAGQPGAWPCRHGTMCAYNAALVAPDAKLLDIAAHTHGRFAIGRRRMSVVLSDVIPAFNHLRDLMTLSEDERGFHSLVVSNSWGMFNPDWDTIPGATGSYFDDPRHPFFELLEDLASIGIDLVFAAGNCGPACPDGRCMPLPADAAHRRIGGANAHRDVLCVTGVDIHRRLAGYASHGPGTLQHEKPDVASYTHFRGSHAFGANQADTGTSAACPLAAGVVAALRSQFPMDPAIQSRSPAALRDYLRKTADNPQQHGWNAEFGYGVLDTSQFDTAGNVL